MKNVIKYSILFSVMMIATLFVIYGVWKFQGHNSELNHRFNFVNKGKTEFNNFGILSPIQVSKIETVFDTIKFQRNFPYPIASDFNLVVPNHNMEQEVAGNIQKAIMDSVAAISFHHFGIDGRNDQVFQVYNSDSLSLKDYQTRFVIYGTASPEAKKYGLEKSLQVGHLEPENQKLAEDRLQRTANILKSNGISVVLGKSKELQLSDQVHIKNALIDKTILDSMRYVHLDASIVGKNKEVTTVSLPVLLPLLLLLLLPLFRRLREIKGSGFIDSLREFLKGLGVMILILLFLYILSLFAREILWILMIIGALFLIWVLYWIYKYWFVIWQSLWFLVSELFLLLFSILCWILKLIKMFFVWIWQLLVSIVMAIKKFFTYWWRRFLICWNTLTPCWKRVFVVMLTIIILLTLKVFGVL